jgi:hypothetical protein
VVEKYIKDGKVGVLYSPGYGAGWSTWGQTEMAVDKELVQAFIEGGASECCRVAKKLYPDSYLGGADDLQLEWVHVGTTFRINEYDGSESIEYFNDRSFMTA